MFLSFEQSVEFLDQLEKTAVVFLFFDQSAELIHALAILWFHHGPLDVAFQVQAHTAHCLAGQAFSLRDCAGCAKILVEDGVQSSGKRSGENRQSTLPKR